MNVVSVMAHQDDEMQCLGTMLKCRKRGDRLFFITLTDGSKGFVDTPDISREEASLIRDTEMRDVVSAVNGEYINLKEYDEFLYDTPEIRIRLIESIRKTEAGLIFTHYEKDYNLDHTTVNGLVRQCAMHACLPVIKTDSPPVKEHPAIFMVEPHGPSDFIPGHYIDISSFYEEKTKLLGFHVSQEKAFMKMFGKRLGEMCTITTRFRGWQVGVEHAEAFISMRSRGSMKPFNTLP